MKTAGLDHQKKVCACIARGLTCGPGLVGRADRYATPPPPLNPSAHHFLTVAPVSTRDARLKTNKSFVYVA
ncbi:uncharacterized protein SETTUDRAFT_163498 [Exserohilum turcica Et28A]|uniref:Uncharacterized protein n=1 Tax=Exserohilum turcicum (strain 28A) TaxID=671987 RepID=R0K8L5_EXST2|nr:uncharacterized protein SETTUDRAFT_163498 [Exserohilum turcica Et28A]EOA84607.1 hypothetical protein SETTUDRAFT_163498 [Exserohilum turcica Et28A]